MDEYSQFKSRIMMAYQTLGCVMEGEVSDSALLEAAIEMGCCMSSIQIEAYLTLFILCDTGVTSKTQRHDLFVALQQGRWQEYVG